MILFWAIIILGVFYLVKLITGGNKTTEDRETSEDILKKRYAQGEITKEEFEERMDV